MSEQDELIVSDFSQKLFNDFDSITTFVKAFLNDDKIPFKIEVTRNYEFVLTYASLPNRSSEGDE